MNPTTLAAAAASADAAHARIVARAESLAGKPAAVDAWILAGAAHRQAANLRMMLATNERRTT